MPVIKNLKMIKHCGTPNRTPYDGILRKNEEYYITFCHGNIDGSMELGIQGRMIETSPQTLRSDIYKHLKYRISKSSPINLFCCYPDDVKSKYNNKIRENNIKILTKGDKGIFVSFHDKKGIPLINDNYSGIRKIVDIFYRPVNSLYSDPGTELLEDIFAGKIKDDQ